MSMPGFVFYFRCDTCDRNSEDYLVFVFPDLFRSDIVLPAWSRTHQCWAEIQLALSTEQRKNLELNPQHLLDLAASLSTDTLTVCVPRMNSDKGECIVSVTPEAVCPYCGQACCTIFGYPPQEQKLPLVQISPEEWPFVPLTSIDLSIRTQNICAALGVRTLGQLREQRDAVINHRKASSDTVAEVDRWLALGNPS